MAESHLDGPADIAEPRPPRLILGDCLVEMAGIDDGSVDCVVTSPPYGVDKSYERGTTEDEYRRLILGSISGCGRVMDGGSFLVLNIDDRICSPTRMVAPIVAAAADEAGLEFYDRRVWAKDPAWGASRWTRVSPKSVKEFEYIYVFRKPGYSRRVYRLTEHISSARRAAGVSSREIDVVFGFHDMAKKWCTSFDQPRIPSLGQWDRLKEIIPLSDDMTSLVERLNRRIEDRLTTREWTEWGARGIWNIRSVYRNDDHPAKFPVELPSRAIRIFTEPGDVVLDPFMGSGTTGMACLNTGRSFIGIERDPAYFATASRRLAEAAASTPLFV